MGKLDSERTDGLGIEAQPQAVAIPYALAGIFGLDFRRTGVAPLAATAGQVTASTPMLMPTALLADHP